MNKFAIWFMQKNAFFWFNFFILMFVINLAIPALLHRSDVPQVFERYSVKYSIYLTVLISSTIFYAYLIFNKNRRINRNIFFLVVITFIASELMARNVGLPIFNDRLYKTPRPYFMFGGEANGKGYVKNYKVANKLEYEITQLNRLGFRGKLPTAEKRDKFRIFMLGGSTVWFGFPHSESIAGQLERLFHEDGQNNIKIYNWGQSALKSGQELSLLVHHVLDYRPDMVIVYDGANDIYQPLVQHLDPRPGYPFNFLVYEAGWRVISGKSPFAEMFDAILRRSRLLRIFFPHLENLSSYWVKLQKEAGYRTEEWERQIIKQYTDNHEKMCRIAKAYGYSYVAVIQPMVHHKKNRTPTEESFLGKEEYKNYILRMFENAKKGFAKLHEQYNDKGCLFFDLINIFADTAKRYYFDQVHTSNEAHPIIAKSIYKHLRRLKGNWSQIHPREPDKRSRVNIRLTAHE
ncbi:SGNH/GDSL hydrolase family protein [Nitrospinota bacterium]